MSSTDVIRQRLGAPTYRKVIAPPRIPSSSSQTADHAGV